MLVDTHCHLDAAEFEADRDAVVQAAQSGGVDAVIVPAVTASNWPETLKTSQHYPDWAFPAYGLHPIYLDTHSRDDIDRLRDWLGANRAVAVGEIGLDGFVKGLDMAAQEWYLSEQLKVARDLDLPVILHVRHAVDLVLKQLRRIPIKGGIAHAFNGSIQQAEILIGMGFKLGFGGAMTYSRALNIRRLAQQLPLDAIVLETDSPDIPPEWDSHGRNTPAYLPRIAQILADIRSLPIETVMEATGRNAAAIFPVLKP